VQVHLQFLNLREVMSDDGSLNRNM